MAAKETRTAAQSSARRASRPRKVSKEDLKEKRRNLLNALKKKLGWELDQDIAKALGLGNSRFSSVCGAHTHLSKSSVVKMFELWGDLNLDFSVFLPQGAELSHKPGLVTKPIDMLQLQGLTVIVLRTSSRNRFVITGAIGVKKEKKAFAIDVPAPKSGWATTVMAGVYKLRIKATAKDAFHAEFSKAQREIERFKISFVGPDAGMIWIPSSSGESFDE
jgi:hypothetical protein